MLKHLFKLKFLDKKVLNFVVINSLKDESKGLNADIKLLSFL